MRRWLPFFLLLLPISLQAQLVARIPGPGGLTAGGTWSVIQHKSSNTASCDGLATCTLSVTSTGSGHVLALVYAGNNNTGASAYSSVSDNESEVWAQCTACTATLNYSGTAYLTTIVAYVLSSTAGVTSVTMNLTANATEWSLEFVELSSSSTPYYDTGNHSNDASCTSCAGVGLTLVGNDAVIQIANVAGGVTGISGSGFSILDIDTQTVNGFASALNTNSGIAPTWTQSPAGVTSNSAIAFTATAPANPTRVEILTAHGACSSGLTITLGTNTTAGETIVAVFMGAVTASQAPIITDSNSDSFTIDGSIGNLGAHGVFGEAHFSNTISGITSVKVTIPSETSCALIVAHYKGLATSPLDQSTGNPTSSGAQSSPYTFASGAKTTTYANELLVGAVGCYTNGSNSCTFAGTGIWPATLAAQEVLNTSGPSAIGYQELIVSSVQTSIENTGTATGSGDTLYLAPMLVTYHQ